MAVAFVNQLDICTHAHTHTHMHTHTQHTHTFMAAEAEVCTASLSASRQSTAVEKNLTRWARHMSTLSLWREMRAFSITSSHTPRTWASTRDGW